MSNRISAALPLAQRASPRTVDKASFALDIDPWSRTVHLLKAVCVATRTGQSSLPERKPAGSPASRKSSKRSALKTRPHTDEPFSPAQPVVITVVERLSETTVILRWCSCRCHYGDQVWKRQVARTRGACAVTGEPIQRGDPVFRAQVRGHTPPANRAAMIHPSVIEASKHN